ncbi:NACHT, LRR and PYD domains-containing protein 10 [Perognathus longimembris pacificus]|uniref:NACHT, LRR and PYD domains-containing protein 10 n=1 Tax=Perognathus longimembris pacificus TaxID=214514 RepID=UPI002018F12F|nr:NACHT, LRR and PYD domains-containing protein 10 [Perognathus longimembris pacificus]
MVLARNLRDALLWALRDLEENDFKILKFHLRDISLAMGPPHLARGELQGLSPVDVASRLTLMYGAREAVRMVLRALTTMHMLEIEKRLRHVYLNDYREIYRKHVRCLEEKGDRGVNGSYIQLLLVAASGSECPGSPPCPSLEQELATDQVEVETLFSLGEEPSPSPSLVVLRGSAGTGKTTLVRKMMLDWATGALYTGRFDYVFYVSCREGVLFPTGDLQRLICWCCGDNQAPVTEILEQPERLLFILDGFDELQRPFDRHLQRRRSSPMENVLPLLIQRKLLPTCSLLITTRPPALQSLEHMLGQQCHRHIHILGFSEEERKKYFSLFFTDEGQARGALDQVSSNAVLYKACQVPGICWVVCSWLKRQMERGQLVLETPRNSTDIFTAYVSTFLPTDDDPKGSELTRNRVLRNLCSLAVEGIQHQRFLFEEADLSRHHLHAPSLTAFLNCNDYHEGLDMKKFYSFRHISFQEFFYAMSFLVKEDPSQPGKETLKEVQRLLGIKEQEKYEELTLSMQFLLDILKCKSTVRLGLKFCFKISPTVMKDLKLFTERIESIKHHRSWDLEFSLYENKIKNLAKGIQMSDVVFTMGTKENKSNQKKRQCIQFSLSNDRGTKMFSSGKDNRTRAQKGTPNMKSRGLEYLDQEVRSTTLTSREKGVMEIEGKNNDEVERLEDEEGQN